MTLSVLIYVMMVSMLVALVSVLVIDTLRGDASRRWLGAGRPVAPVGELVVRQRPECTATAARSRRRAGGRPLSATPRARGRTTARACRH